MKAATSNDVPVGDEWSYELKWDGMRIVALLDDAGVRLQSSNGKDVTNAFPELGALNEVLVGFESLILDGEVVAMSPAGIPDFGRLQHRMHVKDRRAASERARDVPISYVIFDVLCVNGDDTLRLPLVDRRALLEKIVAPGSHWMLTESHRGDPRALIDVVIERGLEGIVAKRLDSRYVEGKRAGAWRKIKPRQRQEFIVGGWSEGQGVNAGSLGSLLLGVMADGELMHCGSVGSGFTESERREWLTRVTADERSGSPFSNDVEATAGRRFHWSEPTHVVEVAFHDWGEGGHLRHPVYVGWRHDKDPVEVVREIGERSR